VSKDVDPKTRLQEILQGSGIPAPIYRVIEMEGPPHDRRFTVEVVVEGKGVGRGNGSSKKSAGAEAARSALRKVKSILARR
jgi:ribonuclease-3